MTPKKCLATPMSLLAILILATSSMGAGAEEPASAGTSAADIPANTVRVGVYFLRFSASASDLSGPYTPPGLNLRLARTKTPYLAYLRRLSPHWELELAAGVPPITHTYAKGPATVGSVPFNGQEVATARWFSPTLLLEYKFFDEREKFRPYVGVGFNYTHFFDRTATPAANAIIGGPTTVYLSDSLGPAATAGLSYKFTDRINAIASYSIAQVNSDFDAVTAGVSRRTTVRFNPGTAVVAIGYSF